jgi:Arrestin (or S-antigen), N-terminal domain
LEAKGESNVHWRADSTTYCSEETYFRHIFPFLEQGSSFSTETMISKTLFKFWMLGGESFDLMPGNYEYPFTFRLPNELPSSFEGEHGWVRYTLTATVVRSWQSNHEIKVPITVNTVVDLNSVEKANVSQFHCLLMCSVCILLYLRSLHKEPIEKS